MEFVYSSTLYIETQAEARQHTCGAKPRVDYTLVGHINGEVIYSVVVEVKKMLGMKSRGQYISTLGGRGKFIEVNMCRISSRRNSPHCPLESEWRAV